MFTATCWRGTRGGRDNNPQNAVQCAATVVAKSTITLQECCTACKRGCRSAGCLLYCSHARENNELAVRVAVESEDMIMSLRTMPVTCV